MFLTPSPINRRRRHSGKNCASRTCWMEKGQSSGKTVSSRRVSPAASRRAIAYSSASACFGWERKLGLSLTIRAILDRCSKIVDFQLPARCSGWTYHLSKCTSRTLSRLSISRLRFSPNSRSPRRGCRDRGRKVGLREAARLARRTTEHSRPQRASIAVSTESCSCERLAPENTRSVECFCEAPAQLRVIEKFSLENMSAS